MKSKIHYILNLLFSIRGYKLLKIVETFPVETSESNIQIIKKVKPFTMTSELRILSLLNSVEYIIDQKLQGDFVECGVWAGGSVMAIALKLQELGIEDRKIWLYDTFEGMTEPGSVDWKIATGVAAKTLLLDSNKTSGSTIWAISSLEEVKSNLKTTGYDMKCFEFVVGPVEETLLYKIPSQISLLRLDTDWYQSTKTELEILWQKVVRSGVLIIDDYGHWSGAKKAVDEFFQNQKLKSMLIPIDDTGRISVKR